MGRIYDSPNAGLAPSEFPKLSRAPPHSGCWNLENLKGWVFGIPLIEQGIPAIPWTATDSVVTG